jgi:predicted HD superfamily hydrolase involved in NAD metabolism
VSLVPSAEIDFAEALEAVRAHLRPDSAEHSERTAETARGLAGPHGVDPEQAALAGLLHDWSRDESDEDLLAFAEERGLAVLPAEREHPYLLHARVAAEQLRERFPGIRLEIMGAIAAHTVGSVPMTELDKIVFMADMLEPARAFPGVERLRRIAENEPLAEAFREAYAQSVRHVAGSGRTLHPLTKLVEADIARETGRPVAEREADAG